MHRIARFGVFELDLSSHELRKSGVRLRLGGKPAELLLLLIERAGEVVTRDELRAPLWPDGTFVDFDHGVNNAINRLRTVLGDSSSSPRYIETLPRLGYRFVAPVQLFDSEPTLRARMRWWPIAAGTVLIALAVIPIATHRQRAVSRAAAHEAYLKGRQELTTSSGDAVARAQTYFRRAIELDPSYPPAHVGLAVALNRAGVYGTADPVRMHTQALVAAEEALRLDPGLAEAYVARATARLRLRWDWSGAESDLRRAITLDADFVKPHQTYAYLLAARGRTVEALRQIGSARQLDPLSLEVQRDQAEILYLARRYSEAISLLQRISASDLRDSEARRMLADAYLHSGHVDAAAREFVTWLELVGVPSAEVDVVRSTLRTEGFAGVWRRLADGKMKPGHSYKAARTFAALGRTDEALDALQHAFEDRESQLLYLGIDPYLDPLRSQARFSELLARAGMSSADRAPKRAQQTAEVAGPGGG